MPQIRFSGSRLIWLSSLTAFSSDMAAAASKCPCKMKPVLYGGGENAWRIQ